MKKFFSTLAIGLVTSSQLMAAWTDLCCCSETLGATPWPPSISIQGGVGYRTDDFKWSIAGFDDSPNVLSELRWKDLQIVQAGGNFTYTSCRNYVVQISGNYGHIFDGSNTDSDYLGDDKTYLFSRSKNNAGKGSVYDIEAAVGYRFTSNCGRFYCTPLAGWSFHGQNLHIYNGTQEVELGPVQIDEPIAGLNSTYNTRWNGPWVGGEFVARVEQCAYVFGSFQWHVVSYRGEGHWNLREDIGPFHHTAHGFGYIANLGGNWDIWDNWTLGIMGSYRNIRTRHGSENLKLYDDEGDSVTVNTRFNGAQWESLSVTAFVGWRY